MRKIYFLLPVLCLTILFTSCKEDEKNDLNISPVEMNLTVGDTKIIKVNDGVSGYYFTSGNEYIASVEKDGVITAIRIGETEITVRDKNNSSAKCKVKITGKSKMYTEPCMQFGASISQVKSFEKRTLRGEDDESLVYLGENKYVDMYNRKNEMFHFCKTKCSKKHTPIHLIPYQKNTNFQAFSKTVTINK